MFSRKLLCCIVLLHCVWSVAENACDNFQVSLPGAEACASMMQIASFHTALPLQNYSNEILVTDVHDIAHAKAEKQAKAVAETKAKDMAEMREQGERDVEADVAKLSTPDAWATRHFNSISQKPPVQPIVAPPVQPVVAGTAIKADKAGDMKALIAAAGSCSVMFIFMISTFEVLQRSFPKMYQYRVPANWKDGVPKSGGAREEYMPEEFKDDNEITSTWFGWARLSLSLTSAEVENCSGLDAAMLLKFAEFAIELMLTLGVPACLLGVPGYAFLGGGFAKDDWLSWASISNIVWNNAKLVDKPLSTGEKAKLGGVQWIFWILAILVWVVVAWAQYRLLIFKTHLIKRRQLWQKIMPRPRCTTVLVQGVPEENRTDESFKSFLQDMFPGAQIENACVMKHVTQSGLPKLWATKGDLEQAIREAEFKTNITEVQSLKRKLEINMKDIVACQESFNYLAKLGNNCMASGFVTFVNRGDAERALALRASEDDKTCVFDIPPDPTDVIYRDFELVGREAHGYQMLGYAAIASLFVAFMPLVVGISSLALAIERSPRVRGVLKSMHILSICDGVFATIGLATMMCFLPTFIMLIFQTFYKLKAGRWAQLKLQEYYFWFLVLYVLLVTAVGTSLIGTMSVLVRSPALIFDLLAQSVPMTTHFYLKYVMLQPVTHGMNLTRYWNLLMFIFLRKNVDVDRARELSEPEDQDYHGMGSRSARFTLMLLIGLVFGTICPLMHVAVLLNFLTCRLIYGYLIPFAESRKIDLGGEHCAMQVRHIHYGLLIYIFMMTGTLAQRAESKGPSGIAAMSCLCWVMAYRKFSAALHWETLPDQAPMEDEEEDAPKIEGDKYLQTELEPPTSQFV